MPTTSAPTLAQLENASEFHARHIGIDAADEALMLQAIGETSRRTLIDSIVPRSIARSSKMDIPAAITEADGYAGVGALVARATATAIPMLYKKL